MAHASKVLFAIVLSVGVMCAMGVAAQSPAAATAAQQAAELQFALARSLAQAGEHDAAAREFDRALSLQRNAASATPEQTQAALQTVHDYVESRPELPRSDELRRQLQRVERSLPSSTTLSPTTPVQARQVASPTPLMVPNAPPSAAPAPSVSSQPLIVPNAPPSTGVPAPEAPVTLNPYRHPARTQSRRDQTHAAPNTMPPLQPPRARPRAWWEQMTLSADELLVPPEWTAAVTYGGAGLWPHLAMLSPELLVPQGWERGTHGLASQLLVDAELLIPPGWETR